MPMMSGHAEPELEDSLAAIGQQAPPERGIGPGPGNHARTILRNPLFVSEALELLDGLAGLHSAVIEDSFDGGRSLLHGCGDLMSVALIGHVRGSRDV